MRAGVSRSERAGQNRPGEPSHHQSPSLESKNVVVCPKYPALGRFQFVSDCMGMLLPKRGSPAVTAHQRLAIRETAGFFPEPVSPPLPLTAGPMDFREPFPAEKATNPS